MRTEPRQTRIAVLTRGDGSKRYVPQWKGLLFWYSFCDSDASMNLDPVSPYNVWWTSTITRKVGRSRDALKTQEEAKELLDEYILRYKAEVAGVLSKKVKSVEYVGHP